MHLKEQEIYNYLSNSHQERQFSKVEISKDKGL